MNAIAIQTRHQRDRVDSFVHDEATLLDERRLTEWFDLFAPDGVLWVPGRLGDTDPNIHVAIIYEHLPRLQARVARLASGNETAETPPSTTMRTISNLRWSTAEDGLVHVDLAMVIYQTRALSNVPLLILPCRVRYRLRPHETSFRIVEKRVDLLEVHRHFDNMAFLL